MNSIAIVNLDGDTEYGSLDGKERKPNRFIVKGTKMYVSKLSELLDIFTKDELKMFYSMTESSKMFNSANILTVDFKEITPQMKTVARSRFKRKLIDSGTMMLYRDKLMINPFILLPRNDKNIHNFQHLVQRAWKYLNEDKDVYFDGLDDFIDDCFR